MLETQDDLDIERHHVPITRGLQKEVWRGFFRCWCLGCLGFTGKQARLHGVRWSQEFVHKVGSVNIPAMAIGYQVPGLWPWATVALFMSNQHPSASRLTGSRWHAGEMGVDPWSMNCIQHFSARSRTGSGSGMDNRMRAEWLMLYASIFAICVGGLHRASWGSVKGVSVSAPLEQAWLDNWQLHALLASNGGSGMLVWDLAPCRLELGEGYREINWSEVHLIRRCSGRSWLTMMIWNSLLCFETFTHTDTQTHRTCILTNLCTSPISKNFTCSISGHGYLHKCWQLLSFYVSMLMVMIMMLIINHHFHPFSSINKD